MTIKECVKGKGLRSEVSEFKRFQSVDIDFINSDGIIDETQFDISGAGTKGGIIELAILFKDFCQENNFKQNTVVSVTVVSAADSLEEL